MVEELTEKDEKIVKLLAETGLNKNIAKVIVSSQR